MERTLRSFTPRNGLGEGPEFQLRLKVAVHEIRKGLGPRVVTSRTIIVFMFSDGLIVVVIIQLLAESSALFIDAL